MKLTELFSEYLKSKSVAWYPSSGTDFGAIGHWFSGFGNTLRPDVFVFTDLDFTGFTRDSVTYHEQVARPAGFPDLLSAGTLDDLDMFSSFDDYRNSRLFDEEAAKQEILAGVPEEEIRILYGLGLIRLEELAGNYEITLNTPRSQHILLASPGRERMLLLMQSQNRMFYDFCTGNGIPVPCMMIKRPNDLSVWDAGRLGLQEAVVREQDLNCIGAPRGVDAVRAFEWHTAPYDSETGLLLKINP